MVAKTTYARTGEAPKVNASFAPFVERLLGYDDKGTDHGRNRRHRASRCKGIDRA
jgi:hypothetical protein